MTLIVFLAISSPDDTSEVRGKTQATSQEYRCRNQCGEVGNTGQTG